VFLVVSLSGNGSIAALTTNALNNKLNARSSVVMVRSPAQSQSNTSRTYRQFRPCAAAGAAAFWTAGEIP
jgi:hypothetical protein